RFPPTQKEIFRDELAIYRREGLLADPAMDQSMREVGVSFHAHHLVARPAAGADKLSRIVVSHCAPPAQIEVDFLDGAVVPRNYTNSRAGPSFRATVVFRHACKLGLEGIVSKRLGSLHVSSRSRHWIKIRQRQR